MDFALMFFIYWNVLAWIGIVWAIVSLVTLPAFTLDEPRWVVRRNLRRWLASIPVVLIWTVSIPFIFSVLLTKFFSFVFGSD